MEEKICKNTIGSYKCLCPDGYEDKGGICKNIDECATGRNNCSQLCRDTDGGYQCYCRPKFRQVENTCEDIDECKSSTHGCSHICQNQEGSYNCFCYSGFILAKDYKSCINAYIKVIMQLHGNVTDKNGLKQQLEILYKNMTDFASLIINDFKISAEGNTLMQLHLFFRSEIEDRHFENLRQKLEAIYKEGKLETGNNTYSLRSGPTYINNNNVKVMVGCLCPASDCFEKNNQKLCRENSIQSSTTTSPDFAITRSMNKEFVNRETYETYPTLKPSTSNTFYQLDSTTNSIFENVLIRMEFENIADKVKFKVFLRDLLTKFYHDNTLRGLAGVEDVQISSNVVFHQVEFTTTINADLLRKLAIILYNFYKNVNAYLPGMRFKSIPHLQYSNVSDFVFCMCLGQQCMNTSDSFTCRTKTNTANANSPSTRTIILAVVLTLLAVAFIVTIVIFLYRRYHYVRLIDDNTDIYDVSSAFGSDASSYSHLRLPLKYKKNWKDLSLDGSLGQNSQFFTGDGDYIFCPPNNAQSRNLIHRSSDASQKSHDGIFSWDYHFSLLKS